MRNPLIRNGRRNRVSKSGLVISFLANHILRRLRFLGNGSIEPVIDKLDRNLELDLLGPWTLDHRSFVETAASAGEQQSRKWLQVLTLSYHPGEETYVIITQPNDGNAVRNH